jgi:hypothetical protein
MDRNTSLLFVWESIYNGCNREWYNNSRRCKCFLCSRYPCRGRSAGNQTVNFGTNGGHTGYFYFASDPAVNPAGDNKLTINLINL